MSNLITLETVDTDGAIRDAAENAGIDRATLLKRAATGFVAGGVLFGGLSSPALAAISNKNKSKKNDAKILNYALTLEYLEAAFYAEAVKNNPFKNDELRTFATTVAKHEAAHVQALKGVLGKAAIKSPTFDFADTTSDEAKFAKTAQALEDTGVAAYAGQGPNVLQKAVVVAALSIHSVEARHAAWIRQLNGTSPAPKAFDVAASEAATLKVVKSTGFLKSA